MKKIKQKKRLNDINLEKFLIKSFEMVQKKKRFEVEKHKNIIKSTKT
jgi:hypothetical protein